MENLGREIEELVRISGYEGHALIVNKAEDLVVMLIKKGVLSKKLDPVVANSILSGYVHVHNPARNEDAEKEYLVSDEDVSLVLDSDWGAELEGAISDALEKARSNDIRLNIVMMGAVIPLLICEDDGVHDKDLNFVRNVSIFSYTLSLLKQQISDSVIQDRLPLAV